MSEKNSEFNLEEFNEYMTERMRWAQLFVTIQEIAEDNEQLVRDLSAYDSDVAVPLLAGLLTLPEYQSHCVRLEVLVALAVVYCRGRKKANINQAIDWFSLIGRSQCVIGEDPAEDIFVSLVWDDHGDYRLFNGIWEGAGFYTQRLLEVVATMPDEGPFERIKKSVRALLIISEILCEKAGLQRYQLGSDEQHSTLSLNKLPGRDSLISRSVVSFDELNARGIHHSDVEPFLLHTQMRQDMSAQSVGSSYLESCPLIMHGDTHLVVALPSALSIAIRNYVISRLIRADLVEILDKTLASVYSKLFSDTPLLGGPLRSPVRWRKVGKDRWSTFSLTVDEGYYISYYLFLPSVQTHVEGGFKVEHQVEGDLVGTLRKSIDNLSKHLLKQPGFKKGLIVLVGCGLGKGIAIPDIGPNGPQWGFQSMSAADLVRLSWLEDMSPRYFWSIQDGLEAVEKAGVQIVNPNGIVNLIGWVRSNDGHFVPHEQLPEGRISPEAPLTLVLPLNLLREVRADSDQGYDRHRLMDNTGTWHDVQHVEPNPLFGNESSPRLFASIDDSRNRILTSVYEGIFHLWISIKTPSGTEARTEYQLWEMANEWLHRIGAVLDERIERSIETINFKLYIEFRDTGPPENLSEKPTLESLGLLCKIEAHSESNACKVVFESGFMDGFNVAENIAERLIVRNILRAFLGLLGEENGDNAVQAIEPLVVQNKEARSVHFFYAQEFIDYVQDTLPEKLVSVEPIDHAASKIGLGWHVLTENQGNKIEGREECSEFLSKVVDFLLDELIRLLSTFDRLSTLKKLLANCEKANVEDKRWDRTSAAIFGLHGCNPQTIDHVVEQTSQIVGANTAGRILIEIALCACPLEGGDKLSNIEMSKLLARAALVVGIGGLSDAIYYNALAPEITISPLGDLLFLDEFGRVVVKPMLSRMVGDRIITNAPLQKKNYENPEIVADIEEIVDSEFMEIWWAEMGFDLYQARNIIRALEGKGLEDHNPILQLTRSKYFSLVCSDSVSREAAQEFLNRFSLVTRPQWDQPPAGFIEKDIYPWRFARRLSFVTCPILQVDDGEDPLLVIALSTLHKGFLYVLSGAYYGQFDQSFFRTDRMKNIWKNKVREGHSFNAEVARKLSDSGWKVRQNVSLPEILNCRTERDFGDIDVLAWCPDRRQVLVIECKDLSPARNYSEIAALLSDYQGIEVDGKADKLKKHLDRVSLLQENDEQLQRFINVQSPQIISCLVCSGIVPMQYAKISALVETHVGTIEEVLTASAR